MEVNLKKLVLNTQKRKGRGIGSGKGGHTVGYGQKGQGSRGRHKVKITDEGGQIPLYRKLPTQKGFRSLQIRPTAVTLTWLNSHAKDGQIVDVTWLIKMRVLVKLTDKAKIIGKDKVDHKLTVKKLAVTAGARKAIEAAGGNVIG